MGGMIFGEYNSLGKYSGPHTASSVFFFIYYIWRTFIGDHPTEVSAMVCSGFKWKTGDVKPN